MGSPFRSNIRACQEVAGITKPTRKRAYFKICVIYIARAPKNLAYQFCNSIKIFLFQNNQIGGTMSTNTLPSQNIQESVCRFCRNPGGDIQYSYETRSGKFTGYTTSYSIPVHNQCFPLLAKVSSVASKATEALQRWHPISSKPHLSDASVKGLFCLISRINILCPR